MAVQTKSNADGKPRQKKEINWTQVGVVGFCVLIVIMCILSFGGIDKLFQGGTTTGVIEAGNGVNVEYTMYIGDTPMVTSSLEVFEAANVSNLPVTTGNLQFIAGQQADANGSILIPSGYENQFKMFPSEFNQISAGTIGMSLGETRNLTSLGAALVTAITPEQAANMGIDYNNWTVGSMGILNFVETNTTVNETASTNETISIRSALVTAKTNESMTLQYGYDNIVMKLIGGSR